MLRWRSKSYLRWVCTLPCVVTGKSHGVQPAHFRYPGCGMGVKPMDLFVYPVRWEVHNDWHNHGHPPSSVQLEWVKKTVTRALADGILTGGLPGMGLYTAPSTLHDMWCDAMENGECSENKRH